MRWMVVALALSALFAGCTASQGADGQSYEAGDERSVSLGYQAASAGSHGRDLTGCDNDGHININAQVGGGKLIVTVKDGAGQQIYRKTITGPGQETHSNSLEGASGDWRIDVERQSGEWGWSGQYNINMRC